MEQVKCFIPETLEEALRIRKETGATVLAGGSDLMVANSMGAGVTPAFKGDVLIITNLKELKGIRALPDGSVEIGACTTSAEIARSPIAPELLKDAASRMGAIALRNSATIGGNIGNASPKGDMPQPLILMDAEVVLTSVDGERRMLVDEGLHPHFLPQDRYAPCERHLQADAFRRRHRPRRRGGRLPRILRRSGPQGRPLPQGGGAADREKGQRASHL